MREQAEVAKGTRRRSERGGRRRAESMQERLDGQRYVQVITRVTAPQYGDPAFPASTSPSSGVHVRVVAASLLTAATACSSSHCRAKRFGHPAHPGRRLRVSSWDEGTVERRDLLWVVHKSTHVRHSASSAAHRFHHPLHHAEEAVSIDHSSS